MTSSGPEKALGTGRASVLAPLTDKEAQRLQSTLGPAYALGWSDAGFARVFRRVTPWLMQPLEEN
jgi:hypothetical protein